MDTCSGSNIDQVRINDVDLHLTCDMRSSVVFGRAIYTYYSLHPEPATKICLDTNHLKILNCSNSYRFQNPHPVYGQVLEIDLNPGSTSFVIEFQTTESATAVQYLEASQTSSKTHSFCYTQCQAIHCRALFPVQDSPQVKFAITYNISVPINYTAVAAGVYQGEQNAIPGFKTFQYRQSICVPSYLVAFAVGNISSYTLPNPKFTFYAEPEVLKLAIEEFADIEVLLNAAVEIMTPYIWGNLNLLILPGSFPFGGMENPNLIFVTPSLLAGDKSLTNVIAHEIAHSWTGNAVTNSTWEHFWLNEGFTVYFERKIVAKVFGKAQADLEQANGIVALRKTVELYGAEHNFTRLNLDIESIDPDDAFSNIPYEKGCCFLLYLESLVGEENLIGFLREYVISFQGGNCDSLEFKRFFSERFTVDIDWETWLRGTGMPPWLPNISNTLLDDVKKFYHNLGSAVELRPENWCTEQYVALLEELLKSPNEENIKICENLGISSSKNSEIRVLWLSLVIRTKSEQYYKDVADFLSAIGRMKYVRPLFRALNESGLRSIAEEVLNKNKSFYHSTLITLLCKEFGFSKHNLA
jgi:leukotriene-A4 hydrolase